MVENDQSKVRIAENEQSTKIAAAAERRRSQKTQQEAREQLEQALSSTEDAVSQYVTGLVRTVQAFLPPVLFTPTEVVDTVFHLFEQALVVSRCAVHEFLATTQSQVHEITAENQRIGERAA